MATLFSDDFDRGDSDTISADYTEVDGDWDIVSNRLKITSYAGTGVLNFWDYITYDASLGASPAADYDVQIVFNSPGGGEASIFSRLADENNMYGLEAIIDENVLAMFKIVADSQTGLGTNYDVTLDASTDYTIKLSCIGTAIKGYIAGTERISATDGALSATGTPAMGSDIVNMLFDDFLVEGTPSAVVKDLLQPGIIPFPR